MCKWLFGSYQTITCTLYNRVVMKCVSDCLVATKQSLVHCTIAWQWNVLLLGSYQTVTYTLYNRVTMKCVSDCLVATKQSLIYCTIAWEWNVWLFGRYQTVTYTLYNRVTIKCISDCLVATNQRFVNIWDPTLCTSTECTFNMVCELAWWWIDEPKHVSRFIDW